MKWLSKQVLLIGLEKIDKQFLDKFPALKVLGTQTTGLDHIDTKECLKRKIKVISLRGETKFLEKIPATAEHTMALILSLIRRIPWAFEDTLAGYWDREKFKGQELKGKTLLVVGHGRIGKMVAG